jgi:3-hydroxyacyl-CoA dehydrogenase
VQVKVIGIIGATPEGREFGAGAVAAGYITILEDISRSRLEEGLAFIRDQTGQLPGPLLRSVRSVEEACREADLVIETTPEDMEVKIEIFTLLDKFAKPGAIFATISSLPIHEMAAMTFRPEKCIGMRFAQPAEGIKRLEIVRAQQTSDDTVETCRAVGARMGREVVLVCEPASMPDGQWLGRGVATED